ncbi:histidine kinase dimerization/phosphoacceptor domain -containing protein [Pseudofulvibacter geojedonensis]|uniref:histidine kinase n=1 Tax=Pseudofulvibacter geojedonensis TaxID=1123758 RepID=A0ABW3I0A5_9FLAO
MFFDIKSTFFNVLLCLLVFLLPNKNFSQNFADKNYYLIDSLQYAKLVSSEKELIDNSLKIYYDSKEEISKLEAINAIVENSNVDEVWHKYNKWMYEYTLKALPDNIGNKKVNKRNKYLLQYHANSINNTGIIYNDKGDYPKALEHYYKSLTIREKIQDSLKYPEIYGNISTIYWSLRNFKKAESVLEKGIAIAKKNNDQIMSSMLLSNLASIYLEEERYQEAEELINQNIKLSKQFKNKVDVGQLFMIKASVNLLREDTENALIEIKKALDIFEAHGYVHGKLSALRILVKIYIKKGQNGIAKTNALNYLELSEKSRDPENVLESALLLSTIYKEEGNWKEALPMTELYYKMRDSISSSEIEKELIREKAAYDVAVKEQEIERQKYDLERRKYFIIFISIALFLALLSTLFYFNSYKKKQIINKLLERQKADISKKNEAKKHMLQEIHHRIKNNLQVVNSLLRMQSSKMKDEEMIAMFKQTQSRVNSMAKLHEKMYQSGDLKQVNTKDYLTSLIHEIVSNYTVDKKINLKIDIESIYLDSQTLMPLSLIINELITNSLKYAFKEQEEGTVTVQLNSVANSKHELYVADNGTGFRKEKSTEGLGAKLINSFTRQLDGHIEVIIGQGTAYKITF